MNNITMNRIENNEVSGHHFENGKKYYFFGQIRNNKFARFTLAVMRKGKRTGWMDIPHNKGKPTWRRIEAEVLSWERRTL